MEILWEPDKEEIQEQKCGHEYQAYFEKLRFDALY